MGQARLGYAVEIISSYSLSIPQKGLRQHTMFKEYLSTSPGKF